MSQESESDEKPVPWVAEGNWYHKRCSNCAHFDGGDAHYYNDQTYEIETGSGECLRFPPVKDGGAWECPKVDARFKCGEYKERRSNRRVYDMAMLMMQSGVEAVPYGHMPW